MISLFLHLLFTFYLLHQTNIYAYIVFHLKILYAERPRLAPLSTHSYSIPPLLAVESAFVTSTRRRLTTSLAVFGPLRIPSFQSQSEFILTSSIPQKQIGTCASYSPPLSPASPGHIQYRPQLSRLRPFIQRKEFLVFHRSIVNSGHTYHSLFWSRIIEI